MASWEGRSGWRSVPPILTTILVMFVVIVPSIAAARTVEAEQAAPCPHPKGWKPADSLRILAEHREWLEKQVGFSQEWPVSHPQGRANLCNADLVRAQLNEADLRKADLNDANLFEAQLNKANLSGADLNEANLFDAQLNEANLFGAQLT